MSSPYENLINPNLYQVFLVSSPCSFPAGFAHHNWFVVNRKGIISRWEVLHLKNGQGHVGDHLYTNAFEPFLGIGILHLTGSPRWQSRLRARIEGGEGSLAQQVVDYIENSPATYPYQNKYSFIGPNSNTYIKWVLNKFPQFVGKLPWNSFGKNYDLDEIN